MEQRLLRLDPPATVRVLESAASYEACKDEGLVEGDEPPKGWDVSDAAGDPAVFADEEAGAERREVLRRVIEKAAAETPFSEPEVPSDPLAYRPFPVRFLPEHLGAFVRDRAGAMGCDPALIAVPTLAVCAGAVGATRRAEVKGGWTEPTPVFAATIGLSGGHKSPAADCVMDVVREMQRAEKRRYDAAMAAYKLNHRAWEVRAKRVKHASPSTLEPEPEKPVLRTLFLSDVTTEALMRRLVESGRGLFCFVDELAGLFGMMDRYAGKGGGDLAKWLEFHGGRDARVDRKTGDDPVLYVPDACVSLFGTTQPAVVKRLLTAEMVESGLAPGSSSPARRHGRRSGPTPSPTQPCGRGCGRRWRRCGRWGRRPPTAARRRGRWWSRSPRRPSGCFGTTTTASGVRSRPPAGPRRRRSARPAATRCGWR